MRIETPAARRTDPKSSHDAAEAVTKSGARLSQQMACLKAVKENPGSTSAQIAIITGLDRYQAARRLADLKDTSVEHGELVDDGLCIRPCVTWWPIKETKKEERK